LFSTFPRNLTALRPACAEQGYSECGPPEYRRPQGTSFAAAIVSAGAALVRASWPNLRDEQIIGLLERTASDQTSATGCRRCTADRDPQSGWGRLDVAAAVNYAGRLPPIDRYETNDDAGSRAVRVRRRRVNLKASLDFWNDPSDVYAIRLRRGGRLVAALTAKSDANLFLWRPGTRRIAAARLPADRSAGPNGREFVNFNARRRPGVYYLQVRMSEPGATAYVLRIIRR
jgi:Subtilase family